MIQADFCPRIVVTRPEPGASATERVLRERGFDVLKRPLTQLVPVSVDSDLRQAFFTVDYIIITSANAIRHAPGGFLQAVRTVPVLAVGEATAQQARDLGMADVTSVNGDADSVADEAPRLFKNGARIGYFCGKLRRDTVETALSAHGFDVVIAETYKTEKVSQITDKFRSDLLTFFPDAASIFSGVSAQILSDTIAEPDIRQAFENKPVFAISDRAAKGLTEGWPGPVLIAERMEAGAMHDLIENYFFGCAS
ncbi:MAG: uroporphyrinogen-III synthase [Pseudomonadota bacterium]